MADLTDISGIDRKLSDLFEAVDVRRPGELASADVGELYARLYQANKEKEIVDRLPAIDEIEGWIVKARDLAGDEPEPSPDKDTKGTIPQPRAEKERPAKAAAESSGSEGDAASLVAIEFKTRDDSEWMARFDEAGEASILEPAPSGPGGGAPAPPAPLPGPGRRKKKFEKPERPIDPRAHQAPHSGLSKHGKVTPSLGEHFSPLEEGGAGPPRTESESKAAPMRDTKSRLPHETRTRIAASGADLSKRALRGLSMPDRGRVIPGFIVAIITRLLLVTMIIGTPVVLVFFSDYMIYFAAVPAALILFAILYAVYASKLYCRVCGVHLLVPQKAHKHEKAHHLLGLGYVASMALHGLLYRWFRCMQCGTAMRLTKDRPHHPGPSEPKAAQEPES